MTNSTNPSPPPAPWVVYILRCRDNSLYTGITTDITWRLAEHNSPAGGSRYTRTRQPVTLVYSEAALSRGEATRRERLIKRLSPAAKRLLLSTAPQPPAQPDNERA